MKGEIWPFSVRSRPVPYPIEEEREAVYTLCSIPYLKDIDSFVIVEVLFGYSSVVRSRLSALRRVELFQFLNEMHISEVNREILQGVMFR